MSGTKEIDLIAEFAAYVEDITAQFLPAAERWEKLTAVLGRLADSSVRKASSSLLPDDLDLGKLTDSELADRMQMHVTSRSGSTEVATNTRLPNSCWMMMLEAAKRLRRRRSRRKAREAAE